ncbi:MAG: methyl-accepting chemotaxis protein [Kamptonema sp. SIO4C4]|nr:methyl-accepting chemotaxis protein [Kamptonema sp. SIO4C4]
MTKFLDNSSVYHDSEKHPKPNLEKKIVNFKLRHWIIAGYAVPIVLFVVSILVVWANVQTVRKESASLERSRQAISLIGDLAFNMQTVSRATRGYLLEPSPVSLQSYEVAQAAVQEQVPRLSEVILDEQQQQTFNQIIVEIDELTAFNANLIEQVQQQGVEAAIATWKAQGGREKAETLSDLLSDFKQQENILVQQNVELQENALNKLVYALILATSLAILVSVLLGGLIIRTIAQRMNETTNHLATSSSEIAATIEEQERTASQQAASVNQTTTTMDELGASSQQSAEQAEAAANAAKRALELADGGTQAVGETLDGMNALKEKVGAIAEQILRLSEQTNQIGTISQLVADLANQTNMLALNAAVEAVRAGEHGQGFSVVATEIRKLADRSKQSTQKINDLVADIQHSINSTVMVTDEGTKTVENGVEITQKTADAFEGVAEAVNNVVLSNQQISLNIKQQASAIQQVVEAMNTINQGAKESANGITQTKLGTQKLNEATQFLKNMV